MMALRISRGCRRFVHSEVKANATLRQASTVDDVPCDSDEQRHQRQSRILSSLSNQQEIQFVSSQTHWSTNPYELLRHGRGESYHRPQPPDVIVSPGCVEDVSELLKFCNRHRIPVIPFGAGTSVEGHVCCLHGGISLDLSNFQSITLPGEEGEGEGRNDEDYSRERISSASASSTTTPATSTTPDLVIIDDPIATVGAGVTRKTLNDALRHTGLQFVVDPGADASIGGMTATGASGTTAVRYGTMRENVLALECVLADGSIIRTGTKAAKNSAGYDLTSLMVGSEGTLGVITSVTVKLHPIPEHVMAATVVFNNLSDAANCVAMIKLSEIPVLRCELLDASSVAAFNKWERNKQANSNGKQQQNVSLLKEEKPTLFLELQASSSTSLEDQVKQVETVAKEFDGFDFQFTSDENERRALWAARHELYYAAINSRHMPSSASSTVVTDACVPLSKFAAVIEATARDVEEQGVVGPVFGHAGDGNFHCILPILDTDTEEYIASVHEINDRLIRRAIAAGGTCTGEHGVGYGKSKYLSEQYGPGAVSTMKLIKAALDPMGILNPGKIV